MRVATTTAGQTRADRPKVVVLDDWEGLWPGSEAAARLEAIADLVIVQEHHAPLDMPAVAASADVLVLTRQRLTLHRQGVEALPRLKLVCNTGTGMSHLDLQALADRGVQLRTTPGLAVKATAEHTLALALAASHRIVELDRQVRSEAGALPSPVVGLAGRRIGICGAGRIGQTVARSAHHLGMEVVLWSPSGPRELELLTAEWAPTLLALAKRVDVLSIHLRSSTPAPPVDAQIVEALAEGSLVVNTARAELVDEVALASRVTRHELHVAADVYGESLRRAVVTAGGPSVLTPHVGWMSIAVMQQMISAAATSVLTFLTTDPDRESCCLP